MIKKHKFEPAINEKLTNGYGKLRITCDHDELTLEPAIRSAGTLF